MNLRLLLWLKLRLMVNGFRRMEGARPVFLLAAFVVLALFFGSLFSLPLYLLIEQQGPSDVVIAFAAIQGFWISTVMLMGAVGESVSMRQLRRYPVRPIDVHFFNVLATPIDVTTALFVPALAVCVIAAGVHSGLPSALAMAGATVVLTALTAAIAQLALAATQRWLRNEWARTAASLVVAMSGVFASLLLNSGDSPESMAWIGRAREILVNVPTVSLPALIGVGVMTAHPTDFLVGVGGSAALFALLVWAGGALSGRAALEPPEIGTKRRGPRAVRARDKQIEAKRATAPVLATLVTRELRAARRTPPLLSPLLTIPVLIMAFAFIGSTGRMRVTSIYWAAMWVYSGATQLAANPFGFDSTAIRWYFMLPIAARTLLLAKNALSILAFFASATLAAVALALMRLPIFSHHGLAALLIGSLAFATCLALTNPRLARQAIAVAPGRKKTAVGVGYMGTMLITFVVTVLGTALPYLLTWRLPNEQRWPIGLAVLALETTIAWLLWAFGIEGAAEKLERDREMLITALASDSGAMR